MLFRSLLRAVRSVAEELGKPLPEGMAFELERPRHERPFMNELTEKGWLHVVAENLDKLLAAGAEINPTALANKLTEEGWSFCVESNIGKFLAAGVDHEYLEKLLKD